MPTKITTKKKSAFRRQRKRWVPDLKRYHAFKSSRSIYIPFDVPDGQVYEYSGRFADPETVVYQVCIAMSRMFGFNINLISLEMKAFMLKVVTERCRRDDSAGQSGPHLCCSSLRAIMEGRIPGIPKPTSHDPHINHYARTTLMTMDVMDTIVAEYLREQEDGLSLLDGQSPDEIVPAADEKLSPDGMPIHRPFPTIAEQLAAKEGKRSGTSGHGD